MKGECMLHPGKIYLAMVTALIAAPLIVMAQIPNPGFEQWTNGNPDGWYTNNFPPVLITITQSSTSHSGSSAAQGAVVSVAGTPFGPVLISGPTGRGFPDAQRHAFLTGFYRFAATAGDVMAVLVGMLRNGNTIGGGGVLLGPAASYSAFTVPISYDSTGAPDTCSIAATIYGDSTSAPPHVGSVMLLDDLSLSGINGVDDHGLHPSNFTLGQNYPNPFNPTTTITFSLPQESDVNLGVFNLLGERVATLANKRMQAGSYTLPFDARYLASGTYFYRITAGSFVETKRMLLVK